MSLGLGLNFILFLLGRTFLLSSLNLGGAGKGSLFWSLPQSGSIWQESLISQMSFISVPCLVTLSTSYEVKRREFLPHEEVPTRPKSRGQINLCKGGILTVPRQKSNLKLVSLEKLKILLPLFCMYILFFHMFWKRNQLACRSHISHGLCVP